MIKKKNFETNAKHYIIEDNHKNNNNNAQYLFVHALIMNVVGFLALNGNVDYVKNGLVLIVMR